MKTPDPTSLFLIMHRIRTHLLTILITFGGLLPLLALDRPNILWLSAEDHGPHLGCYGDTYADTPNLDAFAKSSLLYKNAISTAPVCAPARTTIICGMYAPSLGAHHMRSEVAKPEWLKFYPQYLREAGYYCTNNSKTDYNIQHNIRDIWDESSRKAHYDKRKKGQPFFAIFNQTCTHESQIRSRNSKTKHDPSKAPVPPYHPDVPAVRDNWAQYYDRLSQMDQWFGAHLRALREKGLADDTIVIFWADHGSGMPRGKRYAGWSGLHVPMIMHIPEKWKHLRPPEYNSGDTSNRLVGFVDLGATMLSLAGIQPPAFLQGKPFAGKHVTAKPTHSFGFRGRMDERPDCSRTVTDGRFVYIRNFMPHLPHGQVLHYQMETQSTRIWRRLHKQGKLNKVQSAFWERKAPEELYDISKDPHETRNLAQDATFGDTLRSMREALYQNLEKTFDVALLPEGLLHDLASQHNLTPADLARDKSLYSIENIRAASDILLDPKGAGNVLLICFVQNSRPNATGLLLPVFTSAKKLPTSTRAPCKLSSRTLLAACKLLQRKPWRLSRQTKMEAMLLSRFFLRMRTPQRRARTTLLRPSMLWTTSRKRFLSHTNNVSQGSPLTILMFPDGLMAMPPVCTST